MQYKPVMLALLEQSRQEEQILAGSLTPAERQARGELKNWAFKEIVAHVLVWMQRNGENLLLMKAGQPPTRYDNFLELNDQNFDEFCQMTWEQVQAYSDQVRSAYLEAVQSLSEEQLTSLELYEGQRGTLWNQIVGSCFTHAVMHYSDIYVKRGDIAQADQLQERAYQTLSGLDSGDVWQGTVRYNLACHYALTGRSEQAIDLIRQSLPLHPGLVDWSRQDTDLDSLRELPEFQALYA
ncbi:MAG: tetratricopeptide repeat protein [Chloroflexota bacterium]